MQKAFFITLGGPKALVSLSKNISRNGPRNCRSLGVARDDKGEGDASMESDCWTEGGNLMRVEGPAVLPSTQLRHRNGRKRTRAGGGRKRCWFQWDPDIEEGPGLVAFMSSAGAKQNPPTLLFDHGAHQPKPQPRALFP